MAPRFSVVLPVRNGVPYVDEAIRSVLGQRRGDLELIVLDSGSTDGTLEVASAAAARDARVSVVRSATPLSITENWGRIRRLCETGEIRGQFMTLLGHDDRFLPDFLEVIAGLIDANPASHLFQTHFRIIDSGGRIARRCKPIPARETLGDFFLARCWGVRDAYGTGYVFRPQDYVACGAMPMYPRLLFSDDLLWLRLLKLGDKVTSDQTCFEYRAHSTSASSGHHAADKYLAFLEAFSLFVRDVKAEFPGLIENETCRFAYKKRIGSALHYVEQGGYRAGLGFAAFEEHWRPLAAEFDRLGAELQDTSGVPMTFHYRPWKRFVHALRRLVSLTRA